MKNLSYPHRDPLIKALAHYTAQAEKDLVDLVGWGEVTERDVSSAE